MKSESDYRFRAALLASVLLHGAAMTLSLPSPRVAAPETLPPLQVRVLELPPPQPQAALPPAAPAAEPRLPAPPKPKAKPKRPKPLLAAPQNIPEPAPAPPAEEPVETAAVPPPAPEPEPAPAATPATPAGATPSPELLAGYGKAISQTLARYKEYPRIAQLRGWEGAVTMELRVSPSGGMLEARVHTSSGYAVLDDQALAMAARAKQFPPPPEGLRERDIEVLVPVVFRLTP